jgi:hypothetical protein
MVLPAASADVIEQVAVYRSGVPEPGDPVAPAFVQVDAMQLPPAESVIVTVPVGVVIPLVSNVAR